MPPLSDFMPGDPVDVRGSQATWYPGVVASVDDMKIIVDIDMPQPTGNEWSGLTLRFGGDDPVPQAIVWKASEAIGTPETSHIRVRV